jgi:SulP family sulfate permease
MLGFVNGLAIVIFLAQLGQFKVMDGNEQLQWMQGSELYIMGGLVALTMAIIHFLPKLTTAIPSSLAAILVVTGLVIGLDLESRTVLDYLKDMSGDLNATIAGGFPEFHIPAVPFNFETFKIIFPYALVLAAIGLIESLLTLTLIDEITETRGNSNKECIGQGAANVTCGVFGAMGGCAMIGQSMININSGGRSRLSGITAAVLLLGFILFAASLIEMIPLAALVGVIVSALVFAWEHAKHIYTNNYIDEQGSKVYELHGPLFFGSVKNFAELFDINNDPNDVIIEFKYSRVADHSAIEAIVSLAERYKKAGKTVHLRHLSPDCIELLNKAKDLVEVNVIEDPNYKVASDKLA